MTLAMLVSYILSMAFLCSLANAQFRRGMQPRGNVVDLSALRQELHKVEQDGDMLTKEGEELKRQIANLRVTCAQDVQALDKQFVAMMNKAQENQVILHQLLKRIQQEEAEHIKLEAELKRLSEVLEIMQYQHEIIQQDLQLAQTRRQNETAKNCHQITQELAALAQDETRGRSFNVYKIRNRKTSKETRDRLWLSNKVNIANLFKERIKKVRDGLEREYRTELENCNVKKENLNALIRTTAHALETSERSIAQLKKDLHESIEFSEALRLEIKTGREFIRELESSVQKLRESFLSFTEDNSCYAGIKAMD